MNQDTELGVGCWVLSVNGLSQDTELGVGCWVLGVNGLSQDTGARPFSSVLALTPEGSHRE